MSNARKAAAKPAPSIVDILGLAAPRETEVALCLAGDLAAAAERLEAQLAALDGRPAPTSLAETSPRAALEAELADVHEAMREREITFRFRALGRKAWSDLLAAHPARNSAENWNPETLTPALLAACAIEPVMDVEQAEALLEIANDRQRGQLFTAAWSANTGENRVPFSPAASPNRSSSGAK